MATYLVKKNNVISMIRGDTFRFDVTISDDSSPCGVYRLSNQDVLYFGLMEPNKNFEDSVLVKEYPAGITPINEDGSITITLNSEDTWNLFPGKYFYTIKLNRIKKAGSEIEPDSEEEPVDSEEEHIVPKGGFRGYDFEEEDSESSEEEDIDEIITVIGKTEFFILD